MTSLRGVRVSRYWVSWWSGYYANEGCTKPPFQVWISGYRERADGMDECAICAVIDAEREDEIWEAVHKHFPDCEERFCEQKDDDFCPGDRFPGFDGRTSLRKALVQKEPRHD